MKKGLFCLLLLAGCSSMQPMTAEEKTFSGVFEAPGFSKGQIYDSVNIWIAQNFTSADAVLEYQNRDEGVIIGNGITEYACAGVSCAFKTTWGLAFTMRADVKEGKFKLTFSNLALEDGSAFQYREDLPHQKNKLLSYGDAIIASLKKDADSRDW